jgi:homoserine O-acetyltransferase
LHQPAHHVGLARRAERRAGFLGLLHRDQALDDLAALDQKRVHRLVDAVDLAPQVGERLVVLARRFRHGFVPAIGLIDRCRPTDAEIKENIDSGGQRPIYAGLTALGGPRPGSVTRPGSTMAEASATLDLADRTREADHPHSPVVRFSANNPLRLDAGVDFAPLQIAYQTYGTLNAERSNAVLVCHALTGDQHVVNTHPVTGKPGWWETMVGPGRPIDTERYFVICPNVVGGCMGSSGPASTNPATGMPWGLDFPVITVRDMVRAQAMLLDHLGIDSLFAVAGGSMGGMQVLQWAASYPQRVFAALPIAAATRHSAQNIAFHEVGRQAVMADPDWRGGRYFAEGTNPRRGLAVARMGAHITYLSDAALHRKFGRRFPGPRQSDVLLRCRFSGRVLSAAPGHHLRRALRRQFLSLSDPRHGLFRSRRRL